MSAGPRGASLSELCPLQSLTTRISSAVHSCAASAEPPMRFVAPPAHEVGEIHVDHVSRSEPRRTPGLPPRLRSVSRVSHPLDGLLPHRPSGLVSCPRRSWGSCPPELFPPREAVAPLDARCPPAVAPRQPSPHPRKKADSRTVCTIDRCVPSSGRDGRWRLTRLQGLAPRRSP